ncbi:hypothetical protein [Microvirga lenta]|uniref:hypothetical protein n=1 Tax=Microvirga lenta TaxID=2881337 RepID=UPI001CFF7D1F|nr:hypothetical protein [Microvirga lenta]MCB5176441.1 hypothetical protein [Microvirga lenta]
MEAALSYPCRVDGGFLNTMIDANRALSADEQAVRAGRNLFVDRYGRGEIDCLFETRDLTQRWPAILDPVSSVPTPHNCSAGIALMAALGAVSLPEAAAEAIRESHDRAVLAQKQGDLATCFRASLSGRASYFDLILKPYANDRQRRLDETLKAKGYKPILSAKAVEAALSYPCRVDGGFLNTMIDANRALSADEQAVRAGRNLFVDRYGRGEIDCLFETRDLTQRWPAILDPVSSVPTPHNCSAGIALMAALGAVSLPEAAAEAIRESHDRAVLAQKQGDLATCFRASLSGRASYWSLILKPKQDGFGRAKKAAASSDP